jgi:hypothetical protein
MQLDSDHASASACASMEQSRLWQTSEVDDFMRLPAIDVEKITLSEVYYVRPKQRRHHINYIFSTRWIGDGLTAVVELVMT